MNARVSKTMSQDITNILNLIEETKQESSYTVELNNKDNPVFIPMSAEDQKNLIKAVVDSPYYSNIFNVTIIDILEKTYINGGSILSKDIDQYDKTKILLKCRSVNIDDEYTKTFTDDEGKEFEKKISLESHISKNTSKKPKEVKIEHNSYEIILNYPSLKSEYDLEKYIVNQLKKIDESNQYALKGLIATIFLVNIAKYIQSIKIKDTHINFDSISAADKIKVTSPLGSTIINKIIKEIDKTFATGISNLLTYKFKHKSEDYSLKINIDNTFFIT